MNNKSFISLLESIDSVVLGENQKELSRKEVLDLKHGSVGPGADQNNELLDYQKQTGSNSSPDDPRHPAYLSPDDPRHPAYGAQLTPSGNKTSGKMPKHEWQTDPTSDNYIFPSDIYAGPAKPHERSLGADPEVHVRAEGPPAPYSRLTRETGYGPVKPITQRTPDNYVMDPRKGPTVNPGMNTDQTWNFPRSEIDKSSNDRFADPGIYPTTTKRLSQVTDQDIPVSDPSHGTPTTRTIPGGRTVQGGFYGSHSPGTAIPTTPAAIRQNWKNRRPGMIR